MKSHEGKFKMTTVEVYPYDAKDKPHPKFHPIAFRFLGAKYQPVYDINLLDDEQKFYWSE